MALETSSSSSTLAVACDDGVVAGWKSRAGFCGCRQQLLLGSDRGETFRRVEEEEEESSRRRRLWWWWWCSSSYCSSASLHPLSAAAADDIAVTKECV